MRKNITLHHPAQTVINFDFIPEDVLPSEIPACDKQVTNQPESPMKAEHFRYISLGSGSSGNSCYIGTAAGGILIDAGINPDNISNTLRANGISMADVKGILLTHDHNDHIQYVYKTLRNYKHLRLFCTNRVMNGLLQRHNVSKRVRDYHVSIFKEISFSILDMEITAFDVPHDGSDNMGFNICANGDNFVLATDMGKISERARHYMSRANFLVIEANYDLSMLVNGRYPEYLKARIRTSHGHMDNADTARFITDIMGSQLKYIFLCHLSRDNNTPQIALKTVSDALIAAGFSVGSEEETLLDREADVRVAVLPRFDATRLFVLRR